MDKYTALAALSDATSGRSSGGSGPPRVSSSPCVALRTPLYTPTHLQQLRDQATLRCCLLSWLLCLLLLCVVLCVEACCAAVYGCRQSEVHTAEWRFRVTTCLC